MAAAYSLQHVMLTNKALETGKGSGSPSVKVNTEGSTDSCALSVQNVERARLISAWTTEIKSVLSNERA